MSVRLSGFNNLISNFAFYLKRLIGLKNVFLNNVCDAHIAFIISFMSVRLSGVNNLTSNFAFYLKRLIGLKNGFWNDVYDLFCSTSAKRFLLIS